MKNKVKGASSLALFFFSIGTLLLILQTIFRDLNGVTMVGFYYLCIAVICNVFFVAVLLIGLLLKEDPKETFKAIGILLINLPIAYVYASLVFAFLI
ncbi:hypothetical protein ULMS_28050 [Patiriisocius marinistellae]|uniref:Uncharacterized protein n=1 Tax=Patiriisocius marinistellae TaxID=2494560 RepID=A0A5J4FX20_9FLAO|nr:hypothetical protein [Patiriisocius marinistellae]GEQ87297.1 hypothetical protein ULMS_28050 [Patiriisocius marinistellae]